MTDLLTYRVPENVKSNLKELALSTIRRRMLNWQPTRDDFMDIITVANYIQRLPETLLEELLLYLIANFQYCDNQGVKRLEAGHIAVFLRSSQKKLIINYENKCFDLQLLMDIGGYNIRSVEILQLPLYSILSVDHCQRLCRLLPKLSSLTLSNVEMNDSALKYVASLSLQKLDISNTQITNNGMYELCGENGNIKRTLRVLNIIGTQISEEGCVVALKNMPWLEDLNTTDACWMNSIPFAMENQILNISTLRLHSAKDKVVDLLKIASYMCPEIRKINLTLNSSLTSTMVLLLEKFKNLASLAIREEVSGSKCRTPVLFSYRSNKCHPEKVTECLQHLKFVNLIDFSLCDIDNLWFLNGRLIAFLLACPNLQKLTIKDSEGFTDHFVCKMTDCHLLKTLKQIIVKNCNKLSPVGVFELMNITSLKECEIVYSNSYIQRKVYLDSESLLLNIARSKQVNLSINFGPQCIYRGLIKKPSSSECNLTPKIKWLKNLCV